MRAEKPEVFDKIHPILGDCMEKGLGISNEDFRRIETCTIVLHIAASVRFDDPLKVAILMNTRGTVEIFELALKLPTLKSIVHVSTTYCNPFDSKVYETVYPNKNDWKMYIRFAETLSQDVLDYLTPQ